MKYYLLIMFVLLANYACQKETTIPQLAQLKQQIVHNNMYLARQNRNLLSEIQNRSDFRSNLKMLLESGMLLDLKLRESCNKIDKLYADFRVDSTLTSQDFFINQHKKDTLEKCLIEFKQQVLEQIEILYKKEPKLFSNVLYKEIETAINTSFGAWGTPLCTYEKLNREEALLAQKILHNEHLLLLHKLLHYYLYIAENNTRIILKDTCSIALFRPPFSIKLGETYQTKLQLLQYWDNFNIQNPSLYVNKKEVSIRQPIFNYTLIANKLGVQEIEMKLTLKNKLTGESDQFWRRFPYVVIPKK